MAPSKVLTVAHKALSLLCPLLLSLHYWVTATAASSVTGEMVICLRAFALAESLPGMSFLLYLCPLLTALLQMSPASLKTDNVPLSPPEHLSLVRWSLFKSVSTLRGERSVLFHSCRMIDAQ